MASELAIRSDQPGAHQQSVISAVVADIEDADAFVADGTRPSGIRSSSKEMEEEEPHVLENARRPHKRSIRPWRGIFSSDAALDKQAINEEISNRRARDEIVKTMRKRPEVLVGIGLREDSTAREIMQTLTDLHDVPGTLRRHKFDPKELAYLLSLWPSAIRSSPPGEIPERVPWQCVCTIIFASMAAGFVGLMVFMMTSYTRGWFDDGLCNLSAFSNSSSCTLQPCLLSVVVRQKGSAKQYLKNSWSLPLEKDVADGSTISITGDAFRCCGTKSLNCCELYDFRYFEFCDNWPHRLDPLGGICPDGSWKCMFKLSETDGKTAQEVTDLVVYDPPALWPFLASIGACIILAIFSATARRMYRLLSRFFACAAYALAWYEMWKIQRSDKGLQPRGNGSLEEGRGSRLSLTPPQTTLLELTAYKFTKRPTKNRASALAAPRASVELTKEAEVPELAPLEQDMTRVDTVGAWVKSAEHRKEDAAEEYMAAMESDASKEQDKSKSVYQQNKEARQSSKDSYALQKEKAWAKDHPNKHNVSLTALDLSQFAKQDVVAQMFAPIIEPLPPNMVSARSGRSRSSANSQRSNSRRKPNDPASGWAWANKDQLASLGLPKDSLDTGRLTSRSGGSHASSRIASSRPGAAPSSAVHRPESVEANIKAPSSLRVTAGSAGSSTHGSRNGKSREAGGAEVDADELLATAPPPLRQQPRGHERGAAFAAAAVRGRVH